MVRRVYVEKKKGFDVEAQGLWAELKANLHIEGLKAVRVFNRYDIEGLEDETFNKAKYTVFAEATVDNLYMEEMPQDAKGSIIAWEYLPGQYDQRADSAKVCIGMINPEADATVRYAKVILLVGEITREEEEKAASYIINPVDSRRAELTKPENLQMDMSIPEEVAVATGFREMNDSELESYRKSMGFAMSFEDICHIQRYFKGEEKRDPSITELKVIDTYWSDHCRHTTFMTRLEKVEFEEGKLADAVKQAFSEYLAMRKEVYGDRALKSSEEGGKDVNLMDMACIGAKYLDKQGLAEDLDKSDEINACSIKVKADVDGREEDWLVMFKNETHNHPTEIEPFGGAATCLGGAIRDPLSGRVYVYQAMRVTGCADPTVSIDKTLEGKLPQKKITRGAAAGYSSYGNQIGLATGQVAEIYHPNYVAKRMEIGAVIGAAPADHVRREKPAPGDVIILVGGRTGRDGCGGATGSSKEHTKDSILSCGAEVQKGNPPVERNIQRLFRRKEVATLIKRCNDFGAGGVSVAIGELADSLEVNLDLVTKKYEGLDGTELAISESQERMAVVVDRNQADRFIEFANKENLEAVKVAVVKDDGRFRMMWRGKCILNLSRAFLDTNGATQRASVQVVNPEKTGLEERTGSISKEELKDMLKQLNCCSQKGLVERFDSTIGAGTVLMPLGGKYQLTPAAGMAAKLPVTEGDTTTTTLMAYGFDVDVAMCSPYHSAMYAVLDSVTKIAAMGGDTRKVRLTFQEYFQRMTQEGRTWGKPFAALLGALKAQKELELPAIGGKDSMSGTFMDISVPPTLVSFGVGITKAQQVVSQELKKSGSKLVLVKLSADSAGVPDFKEYRKNMDVVLKLAEEGRLLAANTIEKGGIFVTLTKMCLGNGIGARVQGISLNELTAPLYGQLLLEVEKDLDENNFAGCKHQVIGETLGEEKLMVSWIEGETKRDAEFSLTELRKVWEAPLEGVFPVRTDDFTCKEDDTEVPVCSYQGSPAVRTGKAVARPRVLIPTFPGTNCEMDSKRAFDRAGAESRIEIIRNITPEALKESINSLEKSIRQSQIIFLPGGFSGGDEPDGSAKFIAALFRNPGIKDAVADLLENRDGLMLGICNGFQALIKLGLVPYGKIVDIDESCPTLTYNRIGRHASCLVRTRVASVKSPWLSENKVGDIHTIPVSHGEGRFIASEEMLKKLSENGQIATQYVDFEGKPSMDIGYNPNYSAWAVEGITSPDGRVFGKMGHSERIGRDLYKNLPEKGDQRLFEAGVKYFK